ncbi:MAG: 50S ribosomal protein L3 [Bacteriovoracia bacterium]
MSETTEATTSASPSQGVTLSQGTGGIFGVKAGMTQVFNDAGDAVAVTVIDLRPNFITQVKTKDKDGYQAVQIGLLEKPVKGINKAQKGHYNKTGGKGYYVNNEIRLEESAKMDGLTAGAELTAEFLKVGDMVDLTAVSKGKGFQGVMKRHHFAGLHASHGCSVSHRSPGSIGNRADPAKVFKNKKMAGHMGHITRTIQNVKVVGVDLEKRILLVHGSVPGPRSGIVTIQKAIKPLQKAAAK